MKTWFIWMVLLWLPHLITSQGNKPVKLVANQNHGPPNLNDTTNVPIEKPVSFTDNGVAVAPATFVQQMLDLINKYRIMHAAGPLEISQELTKQATSKAVEMAALDKEQIDVNSKFGETIFSTMTPNNIPSKSVQSWYNQMRLYDFHRAIPSTKSMYFTQMIWASTKEFGAGKAVTPKGKIYVVALFNPPGNKGSFENEVRPVTGSGAGKLGDASCTNDYKYFSNSCFKFYPGLRNWMDASERCTAEFATLATVDSISEDNFLKTLLSAAGVNDAWIGMSDIIKEGFVTWLDGSAPHFLDWDSFQASVEGPKCITINTQNKWRYQRCDIPKGFICRKRLRDVGTYEVTIRFLDKVWADALLNPTTPRYLALRHHLEGAILDLYGNDDWFDKMTFDSFRQDDKNLILADFQLEFAPDDNSPTDPLQKLRNAIKTSSQAQGTEKKAVVQGGKTEAVVQGGKTETTSGVLHGLKLELVNAILVVDESLTCPNYCKATQCAPTACNQQCCGQSGQPYGAGGYGGQTYGQQYGYPAMGGNQVPLPQLRQPSFYPNNQCQRPPCPPQVPYSSTPCQRPPCPPPLSSLAAPCPRPPCPPPVPTAQCPRPPCQPPMQTSPLPCRRPPCPPPMPNSATSCPRPPCPPPMPNLATSCPQPPCPPPVPLAATSCPTPPCPPPIPPPPIPPLPYSGTSCPQPPCPPPAPQFSQPSCPTPPCLPNQSVQYNDLSAAINQPFGQYRQLPAFRLPSRRHRLKVKKGNGKKVSDAVQDNKTQPKTPPQPAAVAPVPDYKDFFMPSFNDPNNPQSQSGFSVRVFKPVIELQRPAPQYYGYGNGYQSPQYMYPQTQQYQPYASYQPYQNYQTYQPYMNNQYRQPYRPYASYASQGSYPAMSRATTLAGATTERMSDSETKHRKGKHHRFHHRRRMPLNPSYPSPYQAQYYSNPYPNQGQMSGMFQSNQQYGSYMNYPPPVQMQQQPQFVQAYSNPMQPRYQPSYSGFYPAPNPVNFIPRQSSIIGGSRGLGPLEPPSQSKVCAAPCPNTCGPECTPACCRDKKKRQLIVKH